MSQLSALFQVRETRPFLGFVLAYVIPKAVVTRIKTTRPTRI
jgi:hypothetical protein